MKEKLTYTIYGIAFFVAVFGLQAIAESDMSWLASIAGMGAILAALLLGAKAVNKYAE